MIMAFPCHFTPFRLCNFVLVSLMPSVIGSLIYVIVALK